MGLHFINNAYHRHICASLSRWLLYQFRRCIIIVLDVLIEYMYIRYVYVMYPLCNILLKIMLQRFDFSVYYAGYILFTLIFRTLYLCMCVCMILARLLRKLETLVLVYSVVVVHLFVDVVRILRITTFECFVCERRRGLTIATSWSHYINMYISTHKKTYANCIYTNIWNLWRLLQENAREKNPHQENMYCAGYDNWIYVVCG